ncbi:glycosyltransferase family 4 protein [Flavobacterium ponti]|uniref:Glycosyltransferase family 4 protein n=1 Tax=Flavobacterium ponti TaxID=665133 RepID=A0ABV9P5N1_9FLAO
MYKTLTIVSDTAICYKNGTYYGFNAVVNEIKSFENLFDKIIWIGYNYPERHSDKTLIEIESKNVEVVLLKKLGGKSIFALIAILLNYPLIFFKILKYIREADVVHTRAPSHPAFIATVISFFWKNKIWWHKFAGSWNAETLPFFYKFQRNLLVRAKHSKVTINGFWDNQPKHCLSFENPCLTTDNIIRGKEIIQFKKFDGRFTLCFIGRLDESKGVDVILASLKQIDLDKIEKIHFIGNSNSTKRSFFEKEALFLNDKAIFHGFLGKDKVHQILSESHFLLLPSKSEGFPKVIAEAACYGTIPIVSTVGSIPHYITDSNGFLWDKEVAISFEEILMSAFEEKVNFLENKSRNLSILAEKFTFTNYLTKLKSDILL